MTRFNTGNNLNSLDERDFYDNCLSLDQAMNSSEPTWRDRFNVEKPTIDAALKSAGFMPAGFDFVTGGTLQPGDRNKAVFNPAPNGDNNWYRWNGVFPKVIAANSQPEPKNENSWVPVNIKTSAVEREALRRTYQEIGLTLVSGSFEQGGGLNSLTDILLEEKTGKCYSWSGSLPKVVSKGISPSSEVEFVDKTGTTINLTSLKSEKPHGFSLEDSMLSVSGTNHVSNMRTYDPSHKFGTGDFTIDGIYVGDGAQSLAAWPLDSVANSFVCQARLYWEEGVDNTFIGYNASPVSGMTALETFYSCGFAGTGFVLNDKSTLQVLVPKSQLTVGWYEVSMIFAPSFILVSICKVGETNAQAFSIPKSLPKPKNAQIGTYSIKDKIKNFRFCSSPTGSPWSPPIGVGGCIALPLTIPATNPSGKLISVHLPAGYDPRITYRLAVYCHGAGGTDKDFWNYPNENTVLTKLLKAGYVVMGVDYETNGWGNESSIQQNVLGIKYVKERFNVFNSPYLIVQSMGGMVGLNTVLLGGIKPAAIAGIYPACNLNYQYKNGFKASIENAYNFSGEENFDQATNGYDVLNDNNFNRFNGLRMKFWHSPADTVVPKSFNTDLLKTKVEVGGGSLTVVSTLGEHGDQSSFDPSGIVDFFKDK